GHGLPRRFGLNLADGLLEREALARDVRLAERRAYTPQLGDQRRARAFVERTPSVAGVPFEARNGAGDQRVVVCHTTSLHLHARISAPSFQTDCGPKLCPPARD